MEDAADALQAIAHQLGPELRREVDLAVKFLRSELVGAKAKHTSALNATINKLSTATEAAESILKNAPEVASLNSQLLGSLQDLSRLEIRNGELAAAAKDAELARQAERDVILELIASFDHAVKLAEARAALERSKDENRSLSKDAASLTERNVELEKKISEEVDAQRRATTLAADKRALEAHVAELERSEAKLRHDLADAQGQATTLVADKSALEERVTQLERELQASRTANDASIVIVKHSTDTSSRLEARAIAAESERDTMREEMLQTVSVMQTDLDKHKAKAATIKEAGKCLTELESLRMDKREHQTRLDEARKLSMDAIKDNAKLSIEVSALTDELTKLKVHSADADRQLAKAKLDNAKVKEAQDRLLELDSLRQAQREFDLRLHEARRGADDNAVLRSEVDAVKKERDGFKAERDEIKAEQDQFKSERDRFAAERDGFKNERDEFKDELDKVKAKVAADASELVRLQSELNSAPSADRLADLVAQRDKLHQDLANAAPLLTDYAVLQAQTARAEKQLEDAQNTIVDRDVEVENLKEEVAKLERKTDADVVRNQWRQAQDEWRTRKEDLKERVRELEEDLAATQEGLAELQGAANRCTELSQELAAKNFAYDELSTANAVEIKSRQTAFQEIYPTLRRQLEGEYGAEIAKLKREKESMMEEIVRLRLSSKKLTAVHDVLRYIRGEGELDDEAAKEAAATMQCLAPEGHSETPAWLRRARKALTRCFVPKSALSGLRTAEQLLEQQIAELQSQ